MKKLGFSAHKACAVRKGTPLRIFLSLLSLLLVLSLFVSCAEAADGSSGYDPGYREDGLSASVNSSEGLNSQDGTSGETFVENAFVKVSDEPISTFSSDVDTASYTYFRKLVASGYSFSEIASTYGASLRTEEMLNYFRYGYTEPEEGDVFGVKSEIAPCPWNSDAILLMLNLTAKSVEPNENGNNLVFLIDVSGSMYSSDKLPLLQSAFRYLAEQLTEKDRISIVTYSGKEKVVLEGCRGDDQETILRAINSLEASGSTNGQAGIQKAYEIAESCFIVNGNNRIIMASDGDLNVGISSAEDLKAYISEKRDTGIYLSVLGFGTGNYKDSNMEALADNGNGVYYYIDGESEAERIFGEGLLSTLYTVAEDVKLQLTFHPDYIDRYRLIGYENRLLATEDFEDDTKDAGEVGANHTVTVCYELILAGSLSEGEKETEETTEKSNIIPLSLLFAGPAPDSTDDAWMTLSVRWKNPGESESIPREYEIGASAYTETPSYEFRFASCVIETAMLLHYSDYIGDLTLSDIIETLDAMSFTDEKKTEFVALLKAAKSN